MTRDLEAENKNLALQVQNLRTTIDNVGAYIFTKDLEGKYTFVNTKVQTLFDCPLEEIIGYDDTKFFSLEISNDITKNDRVVMCEGKVIEAEERNIIAQTGEIRYYMSVKKPLRDKDGVIIGMFGVSTDVTARKKMEVVLREKQNLLNTILSNIDSYVYMKDKDYRYLYVNPQTAILYGKTPEEIIGKRDKDFFALAIAKKFNEMDEKTLSTGIVQRGEEPVYTTDGELKHCWSIKVPITNEAGEVTALIGFSTDITELLLLRNSLQQQVEEEIKKRKEQEILAGIDMLTGLNNRRKFEEFLKAEICRAERLQHDLGLIFVDVDHFKKVNDTFGHQVGDDVLIKVSNILSTHTRSVDTVGRWGGEEFLILCPGTNEEGVLTLAENLRRVIEEQCFDVVGRKTASFGVSFFKKGDKVSELVARADLALYKAKESGRNRIEKG